MSKVARDFENWNATPPAMPDGWIRYPITMDMSASQVGIPWDALPIDDEELVDVPFMVEYRPSRMMGWGMAAVWVGPKERL